MARGAQAYPGSARLGACGPPPSAGTSESSGWAHAAGGKGYLNFLYSKWSGNGPETVLFSSRRVGTGDVHFRQYRAETLGEIILSSAKSLHTQK